MARERKPYDEKKAKYSVFLTKDAIEQLQNMAEQLHMSFSEVLEMAFKMYLQNQEQGTTEQTAEQKTAEQNPNYIEP